MKLIISFTKFSFAAPENGDFSSDLPPFSKRYTNDTLNV